MNRTITIVLTLAALGLLAPTISAACRAEQPEVTIPNTPLGTLYIDNDPCQPSCLFSTWVYQESNEIAGLQRADSMVVSCNGGEEADTILF